MQILEVVPTKSVDGRTQRKRQEVQRCSQISGVHTYWDTSVTHLVSNIGVRTCLQGVEMERNKLSYIINLRNIHSKSITSNTEQGYYVWHSQCQTPADSRLSENKRIFSQHSPLLQIELKKIQLFFFCHFLPTFLSFQFLVSFGNQY